MRVATIANRFYTFGRTDVSGIYAYFVYTGIAGRQCKAVVKVYVGDKRYFCVFFIICDIRRRLRRVDRKADDIAASFFK